jgi:hypothetical protein
METEAEIGAAFKELAGDIVAMLTAKRAADVRATLEPLGFPFTPDWFDLFEIDEEAAWRAANRNVVNAIHRSWTANCLPVDLETDDFERLLDTLWAYQNRVVASRIHPTLPDRPGMDYAHAFASICHATRCGAVYQRDASGNLVLPSNINPVKAGRSWYERLRKRYRGLTRNPESNSEADWIISLLKFLPEKAHRPRGTRRDSG